MRPVDTCSDSLCSSMSTGDWYLLLGLVRAETGELTDECYIRGISQGLYTYVNDPLGEERLMRRDTSCYNLQTREWHRFWHNVSDTITVSSTQVSDTMTQSKWRNMITHTKWVTQYELLNDTQWVAQWHKENDTKWVVQYELHNDTKWLTQYELQYNTKWVNNTKWMAQYELHSDTKWVAQYE